VKKPLNLPSISSPNLNATSGSSRSAIDVPPRS
jgi:hypothetical protein